MNPALSLVAAVAVLGFAMVFSVPRRTLPGIMALAVAAHLTRSFILDRGGSLPLASLVAALLIGVTAAFVAPRTRQAKPIYAFAPVIPLIPGTYMFTALNDLLTLTGTPEDTTAIVDDVVLNGSIATLTVFALAVGSIGPTLMAGRRLQHLVRPVPAPRLPGWPEE
jgi:uncharacterized membrane protein YjjB (DUF3815 family)